MRKLYQMEYDKKSGKIITDKYVETESPCWSYSFSRHDANGCVSGYGELATNRKVCAKRLIKRIESDIKYLEKELHFIEKTIKKIEGNTVKLEVGMWVRTKNGEIGKIISSEIIEFQKDYSKIEYLVIGGEITKANHDILELLEPLDLMYIDIDPNDGHGGIVVPRIAETLNELKKWKERISSSECKLVSITTHEEIEQGSYKVED